MNYKIGYQTIKGKWAVYLIILGIGSFFINRFLGFILLLLGILIIVHYKKDDYNKSAVRFNFAINYIKQGKIKQAKNILLGAIEKNNLNKEAYFLVGCILFDEEDYTNALEYLKRGGIDSLNDTKSIYILGKCYYHIENFNSAIEKLESISFENNSELESDRLFVLGKSYFEIDEYEKSLNTLVRSKKSFTELKGEALEYYYYMGVNCYYTDRLEEAKEYLSKVYNVDRDYKYISLYKDCI